MSKIFVLLILFPFLQSINHMVSIYYVYLYLFCCLEFTGVHCENTDLVPCVETDSCLGHYTCDGPFSNKTCLEGYEGENCTDRIFDGFKDPQCPSGDGVSGLTECKNFGTCWAKQCCCPMGYSGTFCEFEILECESDPCPLGATCLDEIGFYSCIFPVGKLTRIN